MNIQIVKTDSGWAGTGRVIFYTALWFLVQAVWVSRLPYPALRIDLLLPFMFGVAMEWSLAPALFWALAWGFVSDTLSGKFWGFHVVSYIVAVCLVHISIERFEFENPFYQMVVVGSCALGQSVVLWLYLLVEPQATTLEASVLQSLLFRCVVMAVASPLILYPMSRWGRLSA